MTARSEALASVGRWTESRKVALLNAIEAGAVSKVEVMAAHKMTPMELETLMDRAERHGRVGLKATKLQAVGR